MLEMGAMHEMTAEEAETTEMEGTGEMPVLEMPVHEMPVLETPAPEMPVLEMGRRETQHGERSPDTEGTGGAPTAGMDGVPARRTAGRRRGAMIHVATEMHPARSGTERVTATGAIAVAHHMIGDSRRRQPHLRMDRVSAEMVPAGRKGRHEVTRLGVFLPVVQCLRPP
mmetsp:Transcript_45073/g.119598  ORF Transcript_45073/g.119598 Transcript_45073/m.119598 type:complete len:169 (-) Transcript_45073:456-962(-)